MVPLESIPKASIAPTMELGYPLTIAVVASSNLTPLSNTLSFVSSLDHFNEYKSFR